MNEQIFRALCAEIGAGKVPMPQQGWEGGHVYGWELPSHYLDRLRICFGGYRGPYFTLDVNDKFSNGLIRDVAHLHELLEQIKS